MNKVEGQTPHKVQSPQLRFTQRQLASAARLPGVSGRVDAQSLR
jgi:hypothetical protein